MKTRAVLLAAFLLAGCKGSSTPTAPTGMPNPTPVEGAAAPIVLQAVAEGDAWRQSDKTDAAGRAIPPWKSMTVTNLFGFDRNAPKAGDKVTVVGRAGLATLELTVLSVELVEEEGMEMTDVALAPVTDKGWLDAAADAGRAPEYPFDVVVLFPAMKGAKALDPKGLGPANALPKNVTADIVKSAVDLNGDGKPDVIVSEHCCGATAKNADCDLTCGETHVMKAGVWEKTRESTPM